MTRFFLIFLSPILFLRPALAAPSAFQTGSYACKTVKGYCATFATDGFPEECRPATEITLEISSVALGSKAVPYVSFRAFNNTPNASGYNPYFTRTAEGLATLAKYRSAADPYDGLLLPGVFDIEFFSEANDAVAYINKAETPMYVCNKK